MGTEESTFYRHHTDGETEDMECLRDSYAGIKPSAAWLIGAGPSLTGLPWEKINESTAPKMCVNFAGWGKDGQGMMIRPDFWTTFDPTSSFSRHVFLNPAIKKFAIGGRRMDLIPSGTEKVCECPNTVMINQEHRGYRDFIKPGGKILHVLDSFIQGLDILYHLGFRTIYCAGTDLIIRPSSAQVEMARSVGVKYDEEKSEVTYPLSPDNEDIMSRSDLLEDFVVECIRKGLHKQYSGKKGRTEREACLHVLASVEREEQYSFTEVKQLGAACNSDRHYSDSVQYLRLARKCMSMHGLKLVSCTPRSRLNDFFPSMNVEDACAGIAYSVGNPEMETTDGKYRKRPGPGEGFPLMRDISPFGWKPPEDRLPRGMAEPDKNGIIREPMGGGPAPDRVKILERLKELKNKRESGQDD
jgi:hypothetical protein